MKKLLSIFGALILLLAMMYAVIYTKHQGDKLPMTSTKTNQVAVNTIAIFGATGTAGDGILKAAMNDPDVKTIYVVTRRESSRIKEGVDSGKIKIRIHKDYLNYSDIHDILKNVNNVYWAIGLSAVGLDEATYKKIHQEFPMRFLTEWSQANSNPNKMFHYVSGAGTNADSRMMWAREKALAETMLFNFGKNNNLTVISYRPSYIAPTIERSNMLHKFAYIVFKPINQASRATEIGEAMLVVSKQQPPLKNGTTLENKDILMRSEQLQK